ncbi:MAG: carboxypeptidase regulatory-like domain-containing protein, partial [Bacteroidales bacterium]|nr:carboxypeptidase regulatory-like domain-containing protein [Bacteroidales bacterium]
GHPAIITGNDIHWDCQFFSSSGSTNFTINMDVDPGLTGDHLFDWHIWGDVWGNPPHDIAGQSPIVMGIPTIDGHVLNGTGQTIAGATVEVIEIGRTATTNATGYYTLYSIPDGTYNLIAYKTGYNTSDPVVITIIGGALVTQDFVLTQPSIVINPLIMNQTLHPNQYLIDYFGILNTGDGPLDWTAVIVYPPSDGDTEPIHVPAFTGEVEKDRQAPSTSLAPEELAKPGKPGEIYQTDNFRGSVAFGYQAIGDEFVNFDIDAVGAYTVVAYATTPNFVAGMAYPVGEEDFVYGVVYGSSNLYEIDVATGTWTNLGSMGASGFNDMTIDPTSGTYYGATGSALYEIDANGPSATVIGNFTNASLMIGIACDGDGNLWGYDIGYDNFYSIDKNTGLATSIGSIGFNANYAQCAFYDPETEQVLLGAFNAGNFYCEIRAVDVTTGGSVVLSSVYYKEMTAAAIPVGPGGWLSLGSYGGTVPPNGGTYNLDAHFNAEGFVAGDYVTADIIFSTYPDVGTITVPVSMTVLGFPFSMPYNLVGTLMDLLTGEVYLTWDFDGDAFQYFIVYRDGVFAGSTTDQFFTDFLPGYGTYDYTVVAVYDEGQTAPAGPVTVEWLIPDFCFSPAHPEEWVWTESEEFVDLEVTNCGQGLLSYTFPEYVALDIVNDPNIEQNKVGDPFAGQEIIVAKGEDDPRDGLGYPVNRGAGGPDAFGYVWIDSDEPGGPAYNWVEISAIGTDHGLTGDDNYVTINMPFTFEFYGNNKTSFKASTNGYLTFGIDGTDYSNDPIPSTTDPDDFLAAFWDDLNFTGAARLYSYHDAANKRFIVQYTSVPRLGSSYINTFQYHLYESNGKIAFMYQDMNGTLTSATIGIENIDGTVGLQVAYNTAYVHDNLAVLISLPAHFIIDVVPAYGTLLEGESETVVMTYSAVGFEAGDYDEDLECLTNALPPNDVVFIPNTMHVYQPGEFAGTVTDGNTGALMGGVEVTADIWQTTTASDGTYSLYVD